ncbi:beta-actin [Auriculariales sp. MPI-PUGE-AT-0066]|nr:beta-actin [Auriculariales sp. MPI-PUGE-AT-0066]
MSGVGSVPAIVIDSGSVTCKVGFAGDDAPCAVFPSVVGHLQTPFSSENNASKFLVGDQALSKRAFVSIQNPIHNGVITNWDDMERIWDHAFQNELQVSPKDFPILLSEPPLNPKKNRERTIQTMFETFNTPSSFLAVGAVLSLLATGTRSGVVLDSGDTVTHAVAIYEGHALQHAVVQLEYGGQNVAGYITQSLAQRGYDLTSPTAQGIVREIKENRGYIAADFEKEVASYNPPAVRHETSYETSDGRVIDIQDERFRAPEALFQPSLWGRNDRSVHEAVHDAIVACDADIRRALWGTIVLSGGNTMFPGIKDRMLKEITAISPLNASVNVIAQPERKYATWLGGSRLASMPSFQNNWVFKHEYDELGPNIVHRKCL